MSCDNCGTNNFLDFNVPDSLWRRVIGKEGGVFCFSCFEEKVLDKNIHTELGITVWMINDDDQFQRGFNHGIAVANERLRK